MCVCVSVCLSGCTDKCKNEPGACFGSKTPRVYRPLSCLFLDIPIPAIFRVFSGLISKRSCAFKKIMINKLFLLPSSIYLL